MDSEPKEELDIYERKGETLGDISSMLRRLAESGNCSQEYPGGAFSSSSNDLATWVSCLADRIDAAEKREQIKVSNAFRESAKADEKSREDLLDRFQFERAKYDARIKALEDVLINPCLTCTRFAPIVIRVAPGNAAAMRAALLSAARTMKIESRINCTEIGKIGKFGNTLSELCKGCRTRNCECWQMTLKREVESALAAPARNCDRFQTGDRLTDAVSALNAYANEEEHEPVRRWNESDWRRFLDWFFAPAKQEGGAK